MESEKRRDEAPPSKRRGHAGHIFLGSLTLLQVEPRGWGRSGCKEALKMAREGPGPGAAWQLLSAHTYT